MKKFKGSVVVAVLCGSILFSSCIGSFSLFNKVKDWNMGLSNKFVNELVFIAFNIIPVYPVVGAVDVLVLNTVEFWSGRQLVSEDIKTIDGTTVQRTENGYNITKDGETVALVFNAENNSWGYQDGDNVKEVIRFNENGTATLANGKTVSVNAAGVMAARMSSDKGFVASR